MNLTTAPNPAGTNSSPQKQLGLRALFLLPAFLLLANPNYGALDILPDAFAYALLLLAFRRLRWTNCYIEEATTYLRRLVWITAARMAAWYWAETQTGASEKPILLLLFSLTFGILELIMLIPATQRVFRALSYMAMRHDGVYLLEEPGGAKLEKWRMRAERLEKAGKLTPQAQRKIDLSVRKIKKNGETTANKNVTERMSRATTAFFIAKAVLCVLPELAALSDNTARQAGAVRFDLYQFVDLFRLFGATVLLVCGVLWLCRLLAYCRRVGKDRPFFSALLAEYEANRVQNPLREQNEAFRSMTVLLGVAALFTVDFYADGQNFLPSPIGACLLLLAVAVGQKWMTKREKTAAWTVGFSCLSLSAASFFGTRQFLSYYGWDFAYILDRNADAYWRYAGMLLLNGAECVAFLASVAMTAGILRNLTARRAGNRPGGIRRRKALSRTLLFLYPASVLSAAAHIAYLCLPTEYTIPITLSLGAGEPRQFSFHLSVLLTEVALQLLFAVPAFFRTREYGKELALLVAVDD